MSKNGVSVLSLLGILFVGLKLGGIINWSWIWVTCPFWIEFIILLAIFIVYVFTAKTR